jgi:hypothetical protein
MCFPSCEKATDETISVCPSRIFSIVGQSGALPIGIENVFGNLGRYCFETLDPLGENGTADR